MILLNDSDFNITSINCNFFNTHTEISVCRLNTTNKKQKTKRVEEEERIAIKWVLVAVLKVCRCRVWKLVEHNNRIGFNQWFWLGITVVLRFCHVGNLLNNVLTIYLIYIQPIIVEQTIHFLYKWISNGNRFLQLYCQTDHLL